MTAEKQQVMLTAVFPPADAKKIDELAEKADRSRSAELRRAVRFYIEAQEKAAA
jgi:predicted transcriptional regulator